ncbi:MAG: hypothetical protein HY778_16290 [Betaproteobacteria bacterium]|nr:hypothetical protein [Betaproteobacteria bacterium]
MRCSRDEFERFKGVPHHVIGRARREGRLLPSRIRALDSDLGGVSKLTAA